MTAEVERRERRAAKWRAGLGQGSTPYDVSWLTPRLAVGSMPLEPGEVARLLAKGVTHVLNVSDMPSAMLANDLRLTYLHNPAADDGGLKPKSWFARSLRFALPAIRGGGTVYVHCYAGLNRGPSTAYAILRAYGWSRAQALERIAERRPRAGFPLYADDADEAIAALAGMRP